MSTMTLKDYDLVLELWSYWSLNRSYNIKKLFCFNPAHKIYQNKQRDTSHQNNLQIILNLKISSEYFPFALFKLKITTSINAFTYFESTGWIFLILFLSQLPDRSCRAHNWPRWNNAIVKYREKKLSNMLKLQISHTYLVHDSSKHHDWSNSLAIDLKETTENAIVNKVWTF